MSTLPDYLTNEELVSIAQDPDDDRARDAVEKLWKKNQGIIITESRRYSGIIEEVDAVQDCYFALYAAIMHYNAEKSAKFTTYLCYWIKATLNRNIPYSVQISSGTQQKIYAYRRTMKEFEAATGRTPTDQEAADLLDVTPKELARIRTADAAADLTSLDAVTGDGLTLADSIPATDDPEAEAIEAEYQRELSSELWNTVDTLTPPQAATIRARYEGEGHTLREVAEDQDKTINQVEDTERKALKELRCGKRGKRLKPYYESIFTRATRGEGVEAFQRSWTSSTERTALEDIAPDPSGTDP